MNDTDSRSPLAEFLRPARNKGKLTGPKPPLRPGSAQRLRRRPRHRPPEQDRPARPLRADRRDAPLARRLPAGRGPGQCLFPGRRGPDAHLTRRQYARLVSEWVSGIGLDPLKYATHSMRRTKATLIYRRTGSL